ncbi:hypothetical protein NDU88_001709, partial [Pleurodeles waltl]
ASIAGSARLRLSVWKLRGAGSRAGACLHLAIAVQRSRMPATLQSYSRH